MNNHYVDILNDSHCIVWILMGGQGIVSVWYGDVFFLNVITASPTIKLEPMTLEICRFIQYTLYVLYRMGTYDGVRGCHPAGEHHYKMLL